VSLLHLGGKSWLASQRWVGLLCLPVLDRGPEAAGNGLRRLAANHVDTARLRRLYRLITPQKLIHQVSFVLFQIRHQPASLLGQPSSPAFAPDFFWFDSRPEALLVQDGFG
jgi:hypothetical protein